ncbi:hypothetical protein [Kushneria phosphatilytica]|uniref:Uncharacterized protein n=1 Tax=Kushneria phosphatilytica TaxID=657387 RepID=A0A5C1A174_9GAMM|nr:hypothetical protein [Kushneria phosphatilytica]QEL10829.1 hypothetical protein FY550_06635 [Kushneria phosphatilytica]
MQHRLNGAVCPECGVLLNWPGSQVRDQQMLYCRNGHRLCTMKEFREAARELILQEEISLLRGYRRAG